MERELEVQHAAPSFREFQQDRAWDAAPDPACVRCNVHDGQLCSREAITAVAHAWSDESDIEVNEHMHVHGGVQPLSSNWSFQFQGDCVAAGRLASRALKLLRNQDGSWNEFTVNLPGGRTARVYILADKK